MATLQLTVLPSPHNCHTMYFSTDSYQCLFQLAKTLTAALKVGYFHSIPLDSYQPFSLTDISSEICYQGKVQFHHDVWLTQLMISKCFSVLVLNYAVGTRLNSTGMLSVNLSTYCKPLSLSSALFWLKSSKMEVMGGEVPS